MSSSPSLSKAQEKKNHLLKNYELAYHILKFLLRYWKILILFAAAELLLFEASRISKKPRLDANLEHDGKKSWDLKVDSKATELTNLDWLDPPRKLLFME